MRLNIGLSWAEVEGRIEEKILGWATSQLSGEEKREKVIDEVVEFIDKKLVFGTGVAGLIAESVDGPVARALVSLVVQHAYDRLRAQGRVA